MMTDKYCPRNEIKKLEIEIWDLKVKGTDLTSYTQRFQELALLCGRMFPEESDKIEKYVGGLPDMIYGSVVASKPKTMQDAVEIATELMDKKIIIQERVLEGQNGLLVNKTLMKMMTDKYYPRNEIKKLEIEIWDLKVKGTDLTSYTQRFQDLALLCGRMFPEESDKIEKYVGGLPDMIYGSVVVSKPKIMQDAVEIATELMDKKIRTFAERQTESKRKFEDEILPKEILRGYLGDNYQISDIKRYWRDTTSREYKRYGRILLQRDIKDILGDTTQRDIKDILGDTTQRDIKETILDVYQRDIKEILGDTTQRDIKEILGDTTQRDIKEILGDTTQRDIKEILGDTTQRDIKEILGDTTQRDIKEILGDITQIDIFMEELEGDVERLCDESCKLECKVEGDGGALLYGGVGCFMAKGFYLVTKMGDGAACGDVMEATSVLVKWLPFINCNSDEAQTKDTSRNTQNQQQQQHNKRQNTGRAYTAGSSEKKPYGGSKPLCAKFNYHHDGPCAPKCHKCNRVGHLARDCRSTANANTANNQKGTGSGQKPTDCGAQGHFKRECPKLKNNNNHGNQVGGGNAPAKVYAVGHAGINPDSNVVTGTSLINNCYASILFDTGADGSFVSTVFSSQIDITPTALDYYYDVELADGRIIGLNTILRGCTLNILNLPFNIDLMPIELGSFDAIIGMDWLVMYQEIIVCSEKIVRIPWGNETLIVHGDGSNRGNEARLHIISYTKTQEYMLKGCLVFLANVTTKETEDKSEKKRLEDVPIVRDFPNVFPEDLSGLPLTRQVEFQIDLIPGAAPVARAPYRLAPYEMKELSEQLKELFDKGFIRPSSSP
ncbi:putative reverse transcriptase domain-containing protein [Tanacetum coccineum]